MYVFFLYIMCMPNFICYIFYLIEPAALTLTFCVSFFLFFFFFCSTVLFGWILRGVRYYWGIPTTVKHRKALSSPIAQNPLVHRENSLMWTLTFFFSFFFYTYAKKTHRPLAIHFDTTGVNMFNIPHIYMNYVCLSFLSFFFKM